MEKMKGPTHTVFSYSARDSFLCEQYRDGKFFFLYREGDDEYTLPLYDVTRGTRGGEGYYLGYTKEEVLASGRDLLGEALLSKGEPTYEEVAGVLPPLMKDTYTLLGGVSSVAGLTVDAAGVVYHQLSGRARKTCPIFTPAEYDPHLGALSPYQTLLAGEMPLLLSVYTDTTDVLELLYFVEPTEPDRDPILWIRAKRYRVAHPEDCLIEYRVAAIAREAEERELFDTPPEEAIFLDALCDTVSWWVGFRGEGARFSLPTEALATAAHGTVAMAAITCTAEHAHYGHRFYGKELHDNFPPNYIFMIEAMVRLGRHAHARDVFRHFVKYVLRNDGRINYRQGTRLQFGASAAEYGMLLSLSWQYRDILGTLALSPQERRRLCGMGEELISHMAVNPALYEGPLIHMCAEADTNERIHVYLNNNLWAIRGLSALASLLCEAGTRYRTAADTLAESVAAVLARDGRDTRFGRLPPFRLGYTATPMTLSRCEDTFYPLKGEERRRYFSTLWERQDVAVSEDIAENAFANYRYYPEMLSSMLLPRAEAEGILALREALGGELLGMTRFLGRIDDWPVMHYARYLLESGRIDKYLLLLYAHTAHHGIPSLATYFEQVSVDGAVVAFDCLPSLLTLPIMLAWAFAYEGGVDGKLHLLPALPTGWYRLPFAVTGLGYSGGRLDICSDGRTIRIDFEKPPVCEVFLTLREKAEIRPADLAAGMEYVQKIDGDRLLLRPGCQHIAITLAEGV